MNESEKIDLRELSPLALAFVGDSVLELLVRQRLVEHHRLSAGKLNAEKVKYVSAKAQFREEQLLEPLFTEDEMAVFKRGRNASKASVAKHASPEEYRASTGFECLLGWLYLNGQLERVHQLFEVLPHGRFNQGTLLNVKMDTVFRDSPNSTKELMNYLRSLCSLGVFHTQFNVIDTETLKEAQKHPEDYNGLLVRVAGYTAYFTELGKEVQDDIISRTSHSNIC